MPEKVIAVTGANGFIGSVLCEILIRHGYQVVKLVKPGRVQSDETSCDITDLDSTRSGVEDADIIVHLAGESNADNCRADFDKAYLLNVEGTRNVIKSSNGKRVIFASSGYVYGEPVGNDGICKEDSSLRGTNPYAVTKLLAETLCNNYYDNYGHLITIVRFFSIIGEGMDRSHLIPSIILQALKNQTITIRNARLTRDFLYVADAAEAIVHIIRAEKSEVYNVASGIGTPISSIVQHVIDRLGSMPISDLAAKDKEPPIIVGDVGKLRSLGWNPRFPMNAILDRMLDYYGRGR